MIRLVAIYLTSVSVAARVSVLPPIPFTAPYALTYKHDDTPSEHPRQNAPSQSCFHTYANMWIEHRRRVSVDNRDTNQLYITRTYAIQLTRIDEISVHPWSYVRHCVEFISHWAHTLDYSLACIFHDFVQLVPANALLEICSRSKEIWLKI